MWYTISVPQIEATDLTKKTARRNTMVLLYNSKSQQYSHSFELPKGSSRDAYINFLFDTVLSHPNLLSECAIGRNYVFLQSRSAISLEHFVKILHGEDVQYQK